tara:strand:+ start:91 stop:342 length:252 start_codon:yes stop_codon:yes gene_type:complete
MTEEKQKIETVTFDDKIYSISDLTPRTIDGFNTLVKLQTEIAEQSYQLKKTQSAQFYISSEIKSFITEDKIKEQKDGGTDTAS